MDIVVIDDADGYDLAPVEEELSAYGLSLEQRAIPHVEPDDPDREAWLEWIGWHAAFAKVRDIESPAPEREPAGMEVDKERRGLVREIDPPGPLYDAPRLIEAFHGPLPDELAVPGSRPVVVLTDRLVGTFEGGRYHVRFLVNGHPCLVSPPGFVDGPARDRSFYMAKQVLGSAHDAEAVSDDDHLSRGDERIPTCVASALLQALAYHETGEPFCEEETCRLYNPHWQQTLLDTMATQKLCKEHEAWLAETMDARR